MCKKQNIALPNLNSYNAVNGGFFVGQEQRHLKIIYYCKSSHVTVSNTCQKEACQHQGVSDTQPVVTESCILYTGIFLCLPSCQKIQSPHLYGQRFKVHPGPDLCHYFFCLLSCYSPPYTNDRHLKKKKKRSQSWDIWSVTEITIAKS